MSRPFKNEVVGGDGKRRYRIATESDGRATITKDYVPEVEGDKFGANVINKLMDIGDDGEPRPIIVTTLKHSKSGNVHTLKGFPTTNGIYQGQFVATADYNEGDTFNGYTAKPMGEELALPDKCFVVGDLVSLTIDTENKKLSFKVGGGGALKPKIYVQLTAPKNAKQGEYWVEKDGIKIEKIIISTNQLVDELQNEDGKYYLYIMLKTGTPTTLIDNKTIELTSFIAGGWVYQNGKVQDINVSIWNNNEWETLYQKGYKEELYAFYNFNYDNEYRILGKIGVIDSANNIVLRSTYLNDTKNGDYQSCFLNVASVGAYLYYNWIGVKNIETNILYRCDSKTTSYLSKHTLSLDNVSHICATRKGIYVIHSTSSATQNRISLLDATTLLITKTSNIEPKIYDGFGGTSKQLFIQQDKTAFELDQSTFLVIKTFSGLTFKTKELGGTDTRLFSVDTNYDVKIQEIDVDTFTIINTIPNPPKPPHVQYMRIVGIDGSKYNKNYMTI